MRLLLVLPLLTGCTDTFLELHPREVALGVGLSAPYRPNVMTCDPGDVYPAGCDMDLVNVERVKARGAISIELGDDGGFWATGLLEGEGEVELAAAGFDERLGINVAPAVYSLVTWWGSDAEPLLNRGLDEPLVMLTGAQIELWQEHYRVSREQLSLTPLVDMLDVVLHGHTKLEVGPGTAQVALVEMTEPRRGPLPYPRIALAAATAGTATVTTRVGGELAVTVVDETAIATLVGAIEHDRLAISPRDAQGQGLRGCPIVGPSVSDTAGILVATALPATDRCAFQLALAPGKTWQDTAIVVVWNQVELRVPVEPW